MKNIFIQQAHKGIRVTWDDIAFDTYMSCLYKPWQVESANAAETLEITRENDTYNIINGDRKTVYESFEDALIGTELFLTSCLQGFLHKYLQIHACTISHKGRAVAIVGDHGTGKSTLACAAIHNGMKALADDVTVISDDCRTAIGFPRPFKITGETWSMKPSIIPCDCPFTKTNGDTYLFFHEPQGKYFINKSKLAHIIFMTRRHGATAFLKIGEVDALRRLLPQGFNFYRKKNALLEELHVLFYNAPPLELLYSNHIDVAHEIRYLLD